MSWSPGELAEMTKLGVFRCMGCGGQFAIVRVNTESVWLKCPTCGQTGAVQRAFAPREDAR